GQDEHIMVHFNGHFNGQFNGAFILPNNIYQQPAAESDAQIAARRAMTKRNSRSFASRISRSRSRKMEVLGRSAKPGITVDTSFARHRGNAPHQVYPQENVDRSSGLTKKQGWFGLGRSGTKTKGLGISKGTPQPERQGFPPDNRNPPHQPMPSTDHTTGPIGVDFPSTKDPKTADSLTAGSKSWQEISPWDRPIPIGISIPSDSVPDFSPYQTSRQRSDSDATLATPNIIITPAEAMKSVWSPDTASDYTPARASSTYSRATFNTQNANSHVPPVPALPMDVHKMPGGNGFSHARSDTLDSAGTAFEEEDDDKRKDRIMSTGTVFEEDDTPLRDKNAPSALSVDTSTIPTPRRSQGWWNIITTPFVMSRSNSVWTQGGLVAQKTPEVPTMPAEYGYRRESPLTPSTYPTLPDTAPAKPGVALRQDRQTTPSADNTNTSPLSTKTTPTVGSAGLGAMLLPRQIETQAQPIHVNIELQDRRAGVNAEAISANTPPSQTARRLPAPTQSSNAGLTTPKTSAASRAIPVFPPPPTVAQKGSHFSYENASRASSPGPPMDASEKKSRKAHNKATKIMSQLALCRRKKNGSGDTGNKKKKQKRSRCFLCCGCCLVILVLLAIIIPLVVVFTKKHTGPNPEAPSQWLNLTGYPPIPTGISTIAQPEASEEQSGCVAPVTKWSCALPKEQHADVSPNKPDQPNFKFEIIFENGTVADPSKTLPVRRAANPVTAGAFVRSHLWNIRAALSPSPAPASVEERKFLGQTTEKNSAPFEGEDTPFFVTFKDPKATTASRLGKRATDPNNSTSTFPLPELNSDGTAAPAILLPFPSAQPLRLFNRGTPEEYYGFYTYFDRSIFLKQRDANETDSTRGGNPADTDGGSNRDAAKFRCTFSQTRFLVQIWTQSEKTKPLLGRSAGQGSNNTFERPGTFQYPVTITIDRHGGDFKKKFAFSYSMEDDGTIIIKDNGRYENEDLGFGGNIVNDPRGKGNNVTGPIAGGTGGCRCKWQNWL
ncbi:hypothetical protein K458DRAFT_273600, partial [Lentithecium fluviatile CBS 122367]